MNRVGEKNKKSRKAQPFKEQFFNSGMIGAMAGHLLRCDPGFDRAGFIKEAKSGLNGLELKERSAQIGKALARRLPPDFEKAAELLLATLHPEENRDIENLETDKRGIAGWAILPMSLFVAEKGQGHFELSMKALKEMTKRFSSEFAIRFFLINNFKPTLKTLSEWAGDENVHVRRLVSEGSRPRLPWAMRLPRLIEDPSPLFPILNKLKSDPELYVRRSVANNLNDIAKDHPLRMIQTARAWKGKTPQTDWVVKHACRTLLKQGRAEALALFGFEPPVLRNVRLVLDKSKTRIGGELKFEFSAEVLKRKNRKLRLEYEIEFAKSKGKTSGKVFHISEKDCVGDLIVFSRRHGFADLTTRKHYPGPHVLTVIINGRKTASAKFDLVEP